MDVDQSGVAWNDADWLVAMITLSDHKERDMTHATDTTLLNRLKRANGHLATIIRMVEENRNGLDIAQQMQAVISALEGAKTALVIDHIEHHLEEAVGPLTRETRAKLAGVTKLAKYL